ncbi:oxidoreductase [Bacillus manliponensis]|uniref:Oxidoreductase n=1 Tax=Bacillus manliponensis TaxID=574376 RepID=A0A073JWW0_9BACI|nr:Gfo/Idh/MocA family oxidoreductase [Bacillus manliponensis]KEK18780.1 oxidoreductase [Bacillus manliponensis]
MITAALIGAGSRGMYAYAPYALQNPEEMKFIAVAEVDDGKRKKFSQMHSIPEHMQFETWELLLEKEKFCDVLLICSPDRFHYKSVMQAIEKGYKILLEKPMSPSPVETLEIAEAAAKHNTLLTVCHVLRYAPFYRKLKEIVDEKKIGNIVSIQWNENVGHWHQAHSFVRGNWRNYAESSSMILQKCCHDMDVLQWIVNAECTKISSFGSLTHFKAEYAPKGSTLRCIDGCEVESSCEYSALKWYLHERDEWPANVVSIDTDIEKRREALKTGPYGRCVYHCDNDVVDHQVVNLLFDNDVTVAFTMSAFTKECCRTFKIMGTKGEIRGHDVLNELEIKYFSGEVEKIYPETIAGGHMGADNAIMIDFIEKVNNNTTETLTSAIVSANSHLIAFAAEKSRVTGETIVLKDYVTELQREMEQAQ